MAAMETRGGRARPGRTRERRTWSGRYTAAGSRWGSSPGTPARRSTGRSRSFPASTRATSRVIVTRDLPLNPKPFPDGVLYAAERLGVDVAELLVVGDYAFDIQAGKRAGAPTMYLYNDPEEPFHGEGADFVVHSLTEALGVIRMGLPLPSGKLPAGPSGASPLRAGGGGPLGARGGRHRRGRRGAGHPGGRGAGDRIRPGDPGSGFAIALRSAGECQRRGDQRGDAPLAAGYACSSPSDRRPPRSWR